MTCEANYQCFSNECGQNLRCSEFRSESRFNGILALLGYLVIVSGLTALGYIKLVRNRITTEILRERLAGVINEKTS